MGKKAKKSNQPRSVTTTSSSRPITVGERFRVLQNKAALGSPLTFEDVSFVVETLGDPSKLSLAQAYLGMQTPDDTSKYLTDLLGQSPDLPNYLSVLEERMQRGQRAEKLKVGLEVLRNLGLVGMSASQIRESRRQLRGLQPPAPPAPPPTDDALRQAAYEAQMGGFDASRAVAPITAALHQQAQLGMENARRIAGGQVGTYGALVQAAQDRLRLGLGDLGPIIDQIRDRQQSRYAQLLGLLQQQRQADMAQRLHLYNTQVNDYNQRYLGVAELGIAGRENMFPATAGLTDALAAAGSYVPQLRLPNLRRRQATITGTPVVDEFNARVNNNLNNYRQRAMYAPYLLTPERYIPNYYD